jgi:hypothetical protein
MLQVFQANATKKWFEQFPELIKTEHIPDKRIIHDIENYKGEYIFVCYSHSDNPLGIAYVYSFDENSAKEYLKEYEEKIKSTYKWLDFDYKLIIKTIEKKRK